MSFDFTLNHEDAFTGDSLIPEGTYEVVIKVAKQEVTKNGKDKIGLHLVVRNDMPQKYGNKIVFESLFKSTKTGEYMPQQFNTIGKAAKIQNGKQYTSLDQLLGDFVGKPVKVTIKHEEYNGNTNARVQKWEPSEYPEVHHEYKDKAKAADSVFADMTPVDDQDIPF